MDEFRKRIVERAKVKRVEMDREREREMAEEVPLGPGGLNPVEVLNSLPAPLREAFQSQSVERLKQVIASMAPAEARAHMKRCVDSGLWVAGDNSIYENGDGGEEDEEEEEGEVEAAVEEID